MASTHASVSMGSVMRNVTMKVRVTGVHTFRIRLWMGGLLIRLGAVVMGCGIQVDTE